MTSERLLVDELLQFHEYIPRKKETVLFLNDIQIDVLKSWVTINGEGIPIGSYALKILCALLNKKGEYMSHPELYTLVFPTKKYTFHDHRVHVYIKTLRKKLGADIILSTRGCGWKINLDYGRIIETKVA